MSQFVPNPTFRPVPSEMVQQIRRALRNRSCMMSAIGLVHSLTGFDFEAAQQKAEESFANQVAYIVTHLGDDSEAEWESGRDHDVTDNTKSCYQPLQPDLHHF